MKTVLKDVVQFGAPLIAILTILANVAGVSGKWQAVILSVVTVVTAIVSFARTQLGTPAAPAVQVWTASASPVSPAPKK